MKNCLFCERDLSESKVFEGKYWSVLLNKEQHYLGRSFIMLKRHEEDFLNLSLEERQELWDLIKKTVSVLNKLFSPDMFNYAILGKLGELNTLHIHVHIYPRYKAKRIVHEIIRGIEPQRIGRSDFKIIHHQRWMTEGQTVLDARNAEYREIRNLKQRRMAEIIILLVLNLDKVIK